MSRICRWQHATDAVAFPSIIQASLAPRIGCPADFFASPARPDALEFRRFSPKMIGHGRSIQRGSTTRSRIPIGQDGAGDLVRPARIAHVASARMSKASMARQRRWELRSHDVAPIALRARMFDLPRPASNSRIVAKSLATASSLGLRRSRAAQIKLRRRGQALPCHPV